MSEFLDKMGRIRKWMADRKLDALVLRRVSNFAWATCGAASYINLASTDGVAALLITQDKHYLVTNNIEAPRLEEEEKLVSQGWDFRVAPWHENNPAITELTHDLKLGADGSFPGAPDLSADLARLRAKLTPEEGERFRDLGRRCAEAMEAATRATHPGQSELEIAGLLAGEAERRGVQAIVNLIATDKRVFSFRHPLPTSKVLEKYAMLVICGRRSGLVCSVTRFVYFGRLPDDIRRKAEAVARIDATLIASTRPGQTLGSLFEKAAAAYAAAGFPEEWRRHHQGGPAGYEPREYLALPGSADLVTQGQVYAWNPSVSGAKSEDSILIGEAGVEILTEMPGWPAMTVEVDGGALERPAILEIN